MYKIIDGKQYNKHSGIEDIKIPDCFVYPNNKNGCGHGEAKLYISVNSCEDIEAFFEIKKGIGTVNCIIEKADLLNYLNVNKNNYDSGIYDIRKKEIENIKDENLFFTLFLPKLDGSRDYINSKDENYHLIRKVALKNIGSISIEKLIYINNHLNIRLVYFQLKVLTK
ncbi:hypothetical protein AVBRAN12640_05080 [Campylobacter sp. RM12640]|uniref:hypothetical protein n=1 Tax=unclassified Campylobacter TaxID=2593542 RepID=UPI001D267DAA|nr:hypothetical protein [Campylobacter sp. RM12640]MBZ7982869.1 hypothetical protein [Campylobacter sp. RM12647]MBZ7989188.1 hypothetical protein [Campylobacter sp. RM12635]MBZ7992255.1 hypothetical protein [Campylobacter sp. RM9333]